MIDWVGQEMEPGGGDEVLAIPISEVRHLVGDGPSRAEIKATIEHNIEELYVEPVDETEATPSGHAVTNKQVSRPTRVVPARGPSMTWSDRSSVKTSALGVWLRIQNSTCC